MLVLGLDPGTATTGYGLVRSLEGELVYVAHGVITTPAKMPLPERLQRIHRALTEIIQTWQPQVAAVERVFFSKNVKTAISVSHARGVLLLALADAELAIHEYTPNDIKQAVSGYGGADKSQMQLMVRMLLDLEDTPRPDDAADALAVAITCLHRLRLEDLIDEG